VPEPRPGPPRLNRRPAGGRGHEGPRLARLPGVHRSRLLVPHRTPPVTDVSGSPGMFFHPTQGDARGRDRGAEKRFPERSGPSRRVSVIPIEAATDGRVAPARLGAVSSGLPSALPLTRPAGPPMPADDPVTVWLGQLQAGDPAAARPLWDRYFHRPVGLAPKRPKGAPQRAADGEAVALRALESFCRNADAGPCPGLADRDGLWRLLATFTLRKATHHLRDAARQKRGGGAVSEGNSVVLAEVFGREPDPGLAVEVAEECDRLLAVLGDAE